MSPYVGTLEKFLINPFVVPADNQNIENQHPRLKPIILEILWMFFYILWKGHTTCHKLQNKDYEDHLNFKHVYSGTKTFRHINYVIFCDFDWNYTRQINIIALLTRRIFCLEAYSSVDTCGITCWFT